MFSHTECIFAIATALHRQAPVRVAIAGLRLGIRLAYPPRSIPGHAITTLVIARVPYAAIERNRHFHLECPDLFTADEFDGASPFAVILAPDILKSEAILAGGTVASWKTGQTVASRLAFLAHGAWFALLATIARITLLSGGTRFALFAAFAGRSYRTGLTPLPFFAALARGSARTIRPVRPSLAHWPLRTRLSYIAFFAALARGSSVAFLAGLSRQSLLTDWTRFANHPWRPDWSLCSGLTPLPFFTPLGCPLFQCGDPGFQAIHSRFEIIANDWRQPGH
jgi:hypothetical protein